jgi:hypothetical protein
MLTDEQRREMIATIRDLPAQLEELVKGLSEEQLTTPFDEGEWTIAQNVHHIADSHINSFIRLKLILTEDHPTLKPYDQDAWANLVDANHADIEESLLILRGLHRRWVRILENLSGSDWERTGYHPELDQSLTPDDFLRIYSGHCKGHLDQIRRVLAAANG